MSAAPPPWLTVAVGYLGFHERGNNQGIEHFIELAHTGSLGDPWCAIFANACIEETGLPGTRSAAARSFESNKNFRRLDKPVYGCIVTRWRGSPDSGMGHVYFYLGEDDKGIKALAGNENDQVQEYHESHDPVTGYWWPASYPLSGFGALPKAGTVTAPPETARFHVQGKVSTFGGPDDSGMSANEGIALFETVSEMKAHNAGGLLLPGKSGRVLGHWLDPEGSYIACRWNYKETPRSYLQDATALVTNTRTSKSAPARPVDWGPNIKTGRDVDVSPGIARTLGLKTGDVCSVTVPALSLPKEPPVAEQEESAPAVDTASINARLEDVSKKLDRLSGVIAVMQKPEVRSSVSSILAVLLPLIMKALPQTAILGGILQQVLVEGGIMGGAVGVGATGTGRSVGVSLIGMFVSGIVSRWKGVASK